MAASPRLKSCITEYMFLLEECFSQQTTVGLAQIKLQNLKKDLHQKANELVTEMAVCFPVEPGKPVGIPKVVEVGGKTYLLLSQPKNLHEELPSYVTEIQIER